MSGAGEPLAEEGGADSHGGAEAPDGGSESARAPLSHHALLCWPDVTYDAGAPLWGPPEVERQSWSGQTQALLRSYTQVRNQRALDSVPRQTVRDWEEFPKAEGACHFPVGCVVFGLSCVLVEATILPIASICTSSSIPMVL